MNATIRPDGQPPAPQPREAPVPPAAEGRPGAPAAFAYEPTASLLKPDPDERDRTAREYVEYRDTVLRPDVRRRGVQVPLLAYLDGGRKRVFDGGTRLEAALLEGIDTVPVLTYPVMPAPSERSIASFLANENRLDWSPAERARFYRETMRREGWSAAEMCRRIPGLRAPRVAKCLKWLSMLPAAYHDRVGEGDGLIPERGAYAICFFPEEQRAELCEKFVAGAMSVDALEERRKALKGGKQRGAGRALRFSCAGVTGAVRGPAVEALRAFHAKLGEVLRRLEKEPALAEYLPGLLKS